MTPLIRLLGSLRMAVPLLITLAAVLAWGTIYETKFGTAAVQRFVYRAWWFQGLLAFLAANLAVAALRRYPWKRHQAPFVLAHLGIILMLIGGIVGGRFGVEGQLLIPEGQAEKVLQLPQNVLIVQQPNPGIPHVLPTAFETQAWVQEPNTTFRVPLEDGTLQLTVDRYYPDAQADEEITAGGTEPFPAAQLRLAHDGQQETTWLLAQDPERFGVRWGEAHALFLEPATEQQAAQLLAPPAARPGARGTVLVQRPGDAAPKEIVVPEQFPASVPVPGTRYTITFKDYFPDFAITEQGVTSRSQEPNNPAVSLLLAGPEGSDVQLLFALHPEFQEMHGRTHTIHAHLTYLHPAARMLPPQAIVLVRKPSDALALVMTGPAGEQQVIDPVEIGRTYRHAGLGYDATVAAYYPTAKRIQHLRNRSERVRAEAVHVIGRLGEQTAEAWVGLRQRVSLPLGKSSVMVEYRPDERELPVTIKLSDFRKIDYPGIQMAAGFESDVQLTDPARGIILMRTISMNNPLRYRGFSFYQSSYVPGPTETTILSVRNDPGTPLVYAGFLIIIGGVVSMFVLRARRAGQEGRA